MSVSRPSVTIIMPVRNEGAYIEDTLRSVLEQDYPQDSVELLIVDGMSGDNTRDIIHSTMKTPSDARRKPIKYKVLDNEAGIVPNALNIGLAQAEGDIIIRVDGHCQIPGDYVSKCVTLLEETGADNVGGTQCAIGNGAVSEAIAAANASPFGVGNSRFHYSKEPAWVDTVFLGAYRREVFSRVGGFDEDLVRNQDDEFNFRLLQANGQIWFDPSLRVKYFCRSSFRKLWRQYFQYGFYKVRVMQKRKGMASARHIVPATFVLALLATHSVGILSQSAIVFFLVSMPYFLATIFASVSTAGRSLRLLPLLPVVFFILHFSYGAGFLWGLWKWRKYWS